MKKVNSNLEDEFKWLKNLGKVKPKPFFYSRVMKKLDSRDEETKSFIKIILVTTSVLIFLNGYIVLNAYFSTNNFNDKQTFLENYSISYNEDILY